jgi:hypothetical protein
LQAHQAEVDALRTLLLEQQARRERDLAEMQRVMTARETRLRQCVLCAAPAVLSICLSLTMIT